jgi:hypothetical protein
MPRAAWLFGAAEVPENGLDRLRLRRRGEPRSRVEPTGLPVFIGVIVSGVQFGTARSNPFFRVTRLTRVSRGNQSTIRRSNPDEKSRREVRRLDRMQRQKAGDEVRPAESAGVQLGLRDAE